MGRGTSFSLPPLVRFFPNIWRISFDWIWNVKLGVSITYSGLLYHLWRCPWMRCSCILSQLTFISLRIVTHLATTLLSSKRHLVIRMAATLSRETHVGVTPLMLIYKQTFYHLSRSHIAGKWTQRFTRIGECP